MAEKDNSDKSKETWNLDRSTSGLSRVGRGVLTAAGLVVIIAGIRAAAGIILPFLVASFIALICAPSLFWLRRKGVPSGLATILVLLGLLGIGIGVGTLVGTSLNDFYQAIPAYQARLQDQALRFYAWLELHGLDVPEDQLNSIFSPASIMQLAGKFVAGFGVVLTNAFTILLTVVFILLEASGFPNKLRMAIGNPNRTFR